MPTFPWAFYFKKPNPVHKTQICVILTEGMGDIELQAAERDIINNKKNNSLGNRMKKYESSFGMILPQRMPIIIRVDGKAFHTYTKPLTKQPGKAFDASLEEVMNITAIKL